MLYLLVIMLGAAPVQGDWAETFSDPNTQLWEFGAADWDNSDWDEGGYITLANHTWVIEDGLLKSESDVPEVGLIYNTACREYQYTLGSFETDVYDAMSDWGWGLQIGKNTNYDANETLSRSDWTFEGYYIIFWPTSFAVYFFKGPDQFSGSTESNQIFTSTAHSDTLDKWAHWQIDYLGDQFNFTLNDEESIILDHSDEIYSTFDTVCLVSRYNDGSMWDNVQVESFTEESTGVGFLDSPTDFLIAGSSIIAISTGAFYSNRYIKKKRSMRILRNKYATNQIIQNPQLGFEVTDTALLLLLGQKPDNDPKYLEELSNNVPHDLINYRYLLHPIRIMILKILYGEYQLVSSDLRKVLKISASDYSAHKISLHEKGYIDIKTEFSRTGSQIQTLYLTEKGKREYELLIDLLNDIIEENTPYQYLLHASKVINREEKLYPEK